MELKFVVHVDSRKILLTHEEFTQLWALLDGKEHMEDKWVGSGKGTSGSSKEYIPQINVFNASTDLQVRAVSQTQVDAIKFCMKQQEQ